MAGTLQPHYSRCLSFSNTLPLNQTFTARDHNHRYSPYFLSNLQPHPSYSPSYGCRTLHPLRIPRLHRRHTLQSLAARNPAAMPFWTQDPIYPILPHQKSTCKSIGEVRPYLSRLRSNNDRRHPMLHLKTQHLPRVGRANRSTPDNRAPAPTHLL